jgi:hypothetical protein
MQQRLANQVKPEVIKRSRPFPKVDKDERGRERYYSYYNRSLKLARDRGDPNARGEGEIENFVGRDGWPTTETPHVHVVHDELKGDVRVVLTVEGPEGTHEHPFKLTLHDDPSGNDVNCAIEQMLQRLRELEE